MRETIDVLAHAGEILQALRTGALLTTRSGDRVNTMTIGWGQLGIEWGVPIFTAYVRQSRYTRQLLDENPEFTVNLPCGQAVREILAACGTKSGRDVDKFRLLGLEQAAPERVSVPAIRQLPLTLECRVVCRQLQEGERIAPAHLEKHYPPDEAGQRDLHIAYSGEIVAAYRLRPDEGEA